MCEKHIILYIKKKQSDNDDDIRVYLNICLVCLLSSKL